MTTDWLTPDTRDLLVAGVKVTLALTVITSVLAFALALFICRLRLSAVAFWRGVAATYIELCRNIPALVWVIFFAYALPNAFDLDTRRMLFFRNGVMEFLRQETGVLIPYYLIGAVLGLTLNTSAYLVELLRAGIGTLKQEHLESARTLGATPNAAFQRLLMPHGIRAAAPGIMTRLVHNMKNTALASFVAVPEFFKAVQTSISRSFYAIELLVLASVVYWILTWGFAVLLRRVLPQPRSASWMVR